MEKILVKIFIKLINFFIIYSFFFGRIMYMLVFCIVKLIRILIMINFLKKINFL